ncbi:hypothetical protein Ddye_013217 [Dipteronia dyeriana]|uniref:RNase H type-1 domain-containing protein n=1 Tax=Dipteronia dyeriana TaxID=168575 RepID=A0AAD9X609_9ROSI|nr:hypothetical protein Ddye_013217 [Dipteronia dyeriana]
MDLELVLDTIKFRVALWFKNHSKGSNVDLTLLMLDVKERFVDTFDSKFRRNVVGSTYQVSELCFNMDGSTKGSPEEAGIGGVLRDSSGRILCLFSMYVGSLDAITAELYTIHKACLLISEKESIARRRITIISDSKAEIDWVKGSEFGNLHLVHLVYDIRQFLKNSDRYDIRYMPRVSNAFAYSLAKAGSSGGGVRVEWGDV